MTFKNLRYGLSSSVVLAASLFSVPSYAATDSIGLTVITTVEIGIDWPPESPDNQYHLNK
ncbi:hypothetical protein ESCO107199_15950 [Escherichia coli]